MKSESTLIAVCGSNDPNLHLDKSLPLDSDGPILTTVTHERFDKVFVITFGGVDRYKNGNESQPKGYLDRAQATIDLIPERVPGVMAELVHLDTSRPHDLNTVYPLLRQWLFELMQGEERQDQQITIDISPGTPAVQMSWLLLALYTSLPVRLIRSLRPGEHPEGKRIEEVITDLKPMIAVPTPEEPGDAFKKMRSSLRSTTERAEQLRKEGIVTHTHVFIELCENVIRVAEKSVQIPQHILLQGETGTGKEVLARLFHQHSRPTKPCDTINCGVLAKETMRSELFGHAKGAYTGADRSSIGRIRQADGGVVFFDELGELTLETQAQLLRLLDNGTVEPLGEGKQIPVDVLIVAATNRDLEAMIDRGEFRQDLYERFGERFNLIPLRRRIDDLIPLTDFFFGKMLDGVKVSIDQPVQQELRKYTWPGNVRELENLVRKLAVRMEEGQNRITLPLLNEAWPIAERRKKLGTSSIFHLADHISTSDRIDIDYEAKRLQHVAAVRILEENPSLWTGSGKPNDSELGKRLGVSNKTAKKYYQGEGLKPEDRLPLPVH